MSSRNTIIIAVVIIALFLGGFFLVAKVPLIESEPEILDRQLAGGPLRSGYFISIPIKLDKGTVEFFYSAINKVNAFIMTTEDYYGYAESLSGYTGSLDAHLDSSSGTLTCEIKKSDTYYFIIENDNDYSVSLYSYEIKQTIKQTILETIG